MDIQTIRDGDKIIFRVKGKLNTITAPDFNKIVTGSIVNVQDVIVDLADLDFISSAGIRSLMKLRSSVGPNNLHIINAQGLVREVFEISGIVVLLED